MQQPTCPLCGSAKKMHKAKPLYGTPVCRKCYYAFANKRQLAYIVDWVAFQFVAFGMLTGIGFVLANLGSSFSDIEVANVALSWLILPLLFYCKDGFGGYSLGKVITRVRVVDRDTLEPIGFGRSFKRNLILLIPFMPLIMAFLLQKGPRLGDGWAKSKVIWLKHANHPLFTGQMTCAGCGYDLRATTSGVCPECGRPVPVEPPVPSAPPTSPTAPLVR